MKTKRILETIALVVAIIFVINGASFAKAHKDCEDEVAGCAEKFIDDVDLDAQSMGAESLAASAISSPIPTIPTLPICPVYGLCIERMTPNPANFPEGGGSGSITVKINPPGAIYATSSNTKLIKIMSYQAIDATHMQIRYYVYPILAGGDAFALWDIGTITIKGAGFTTALKVTVKQWRHYIG